MPNVNSTIEAPTEKLTDYAVARRRIAPPFHYVWNGSHPAHGISASALIKQR